MLSVTKMARFMILAALASGAVRQVFQCCPETAAMILPPRPELLTNPFSTAQPPDNWWTGRCRHSSLVRGISPRQVMTRLLGVYFASACQTWQHTSQRRATTPGRLERSLPGRQGLSPAVLGPTRQRWLQIQAFQIIPYSRRKPPRTSRCLSSPGARVAAARTDRRTGTS